MIASSRLGRHGVPSAHPKLHIVPALYRTTAAIPLIASHIPPNTTGRSGPIPLLGVGHGIIDIECCLRSKSSHFGFSMPRMSVCADWPGRMTQHERDFELNAPFHVFTTKTREHMVRCSSANLFCGQLD